MPVVKDESAEAELPFFSTSHLLTDNVFRSHYIFVQVFCSATRLHRANIMSCDMHHIIFCRTAHLWHEMVTSLSFQPTMLTGTVCFKIDSFVRSSRERHKQLDGWSISKVE